jgi:hypothetical protein
MAERYDILQHSVLADASYFTVDTTPGVANVSVVSPAGLEIMCNGDAKKTFQQGDNFVIGTFGVVMPLGFQIDRNNAVTLPYIQLCVYARGVTSTHLYMFKEIGKGTAPTGPADYSYMYGIMENYDTPADIFIDVNNQQPAFVGGTLLKNEPFTLSVKMAVTGLKVSMIGAPTSLNGTVQRIFPYLKIYHNFPLT